MGGGYSSKAPTNGDASGIFTAIGATCALFQVILINTSLLELAQSIPNGGERLLEESTAHGDPEMTQESWDQVERYLVERPDQVLRWLPCLAGEPVDHDGDGFDGCTVDPDDDNPEIGG